MLYNTMILPYFNYCNIAWGSSSTNRLVSLIRLQKRAVRIVCKARYRDHSSSLFKQLNTLKLQDINLFQVAIFMYKYFHNQLPLLFHNFFHLNTAIHSHYTRTAQAFHMPTVRTTLRKQSVIFTGPSIWNNLGADLHMLPSVASFKFNYKKILIAKY